MSHNHRLVPPSRPDKPRRSQARRQACETCFFESLEGRIVLSAFTWSSEEVYLVELVNRARADPAAEQVRTGIDLSADLSFDELQHLVPSEPLALEPALTLAARQHSRDMSDRNFFDHQNPDGDRAQQRAEKNGYDGSVGENIAAGYSTIDDAYVAWLDSVEHRKNVLSLWASFTDNFHYDEIGVGFYFPGPGVSDFPTYYTQTFGFSGRPQRTYILGVAYDDTDGDNFYSIGEGRANVRIDVTDPSNGTLVGSYTTDEAGNYQIVVPGGEYIVTFVDTTTGLGKQTRVTVTSNTNLKVDVTGDQLTQTLAPSDNVAGTGAVVTAGTTASGSLIVTTLNGQGRPIAFEQSDDNPNTWTVVDIQTISGSDTVSSQLESWTDPHDGLTYAAATSSAGLLLFRRDAAGVWSFRNLNDELTGAGQLVGQVTQFVSRDNLVYLAGLDADGQLHIFRQTGEKNGSDYTWTSRNLSATDLATGGQVTPTFAGALTGFVTAWNALNIVGLDANGDIQAVWIAGNLPRWRVDNLSDLTGAPALTGGLTVYLTSWQGINLAGTDTNGHVSVTWWVPSFGGNWVTSDLTELYAGPTLTASSMTSFVTSWGALNIAGIDSDGKLTVYWWTPTLKDTLGEDRWAITTLSDAIPNAPLPAGSLRGVTVTKTGSINILGPSADGSVLRYHWQPGQDWKVDNLTSLTS